MFKKIKELIIDEYKTIIIGLALYIIFQIPVNYYIVIGGGVQPLGKRIEVENKYESKGTFNLSYVSELKGTILTYGLSFIIPTWERENADLYKYDVQESIEDINFRSELDLKTVNGNATYWAYTLANKNVNLSSSKLYVIATDKEHKNPLEIQDEIISMDGNHYETSDEYIKYINTLEENDTINVKVVRKGKEKEIQAKVYKYNDRKIIGVAIQYVHEYETDPKIKIKFNNDESGPSGGMITTLEIYNQLTEKDLTRGRTIAGTGTIESDGSIGEIGGIEHKILGAAKAKVDLFLVPSGQNYKDAVKYKKNKKLKIKLVEVKNIKEVIDILEEEK